MRHRTLAQRDSASRCRAALRPSSITGAPCRTDGASWPRCFLGFFFTFMARARRHLAATEGHRRVFLHQSRI